MEIPSWAFASAGKSLICSKPESLIVADTKVKTPMPVMDTFYDEIIDVINDMIPKQNSLINLLIELYI